MSNEIAIIAERTLLIFHGNVTVAFQDGKIVNMEVVEKYRFIAGTTDVFIPRCSETEVKNAVKMLKSLFNNIAYGKIMLFIKNGRVVQYSVQQQYRVNDIAEGL